MLRKKNNEQIIAYKTFKSFLCCSSSIRISNVCLACASRSACSTACSWSSLAFERKGSFIYYYFREGTEKLLIIEEAGKLGFRAQWKVAASSHHGVPNYTVLTPTSHRALAALARCTGHTEPWVTFAVFWIIKGGAAAHMCVCVVNIHMYMNICICMWVYVCGWVC